MQGAAYKIDRKVATYAAYSPPREKQGEKQWALRYGPSNKLTDAYVLYFMGFTDSKFRLYTAQPTYHLAVFTNS